jgi:hypothetical protein
MNPSHHVFVGIDVLENVEGAHNVKGGVKRHVRRVELDEREIRETGARVAQSLQVHFRARQAQIRDTPKLPKDIAGSAADLEDIHRSRAFDEPVEDAMQHPVARAAPEAARLDARSHVEAVAGVIVAGERDVGSLATEALYFDKWLRHVAVRVDYRQPGAGWRIVDYSGRAA